MADAARNLPHIDGVLNAEELRALLGVERDADLRRRLERQGIQCFDGRNGIWTTLELVNLAGKRKLGLVDPSNDNSML
jgi:hypothetical protein